MVNENVSENKRFEKLSRGEPKNTKIMAGQVSFTIEQLENEMANDNSDIGRKLKSIEHILDQY